MPHGQATLTDAEKKCYVVFIVHKEAQDIDFRKSTGGAVLISILLAAYNGAPYIAAQIESILNQTEQTFQIYIRDDSSSDATYAICAKYERQYPEKVHIERSEKNSGSARYNYMHMMTGIKDDYVMLCDQDDIWLPDKIKKTLAKMKEMEALFGKETPLLVHTDATVTDKNLEIIAPSLEWYMNANFGERRFSQWLVQNTAAGCASMYNRALADMIREEPSSIVMHDWWAALIAITFGKIGYLSEATMLYRQHETNEVGTANVRSFRYKIRRLFDARTIKQALAESYVQIESFLHIYRRHMDAQHIEIMEDYCSLPRRGTLDRRRVVCKRHFFKDSFARNVAYLFYV